MGLAGEPEIFYGSIDRLRAEIDRLEGKLRFQRSFSAVGERPGIDGVEDAINDAEKDLISYAKGTASDFVVVEQDPIVTIAPSGIPEENGSTSVILRGCGYAYDTIKKPE
jgi:hypothetical protein